MKLYELSSSYKQVQELIEDGETEALLTTLETLEDAIEDKAENIAKMIQNINAENEAIKLEEKRLADRRRVNENKIKGMKEYLQSQLEFAGLTKVKRPTITVSIQKNPASVYIPDESLVPKEYLVEVAPKVDKKAIKDMLKDSEVEWAELKQGQSLRIK